MSLVQPRTLPGALELLPREQIAFQRLLDTIRATYERFGFLPIETPVMELTEVLLTKEGGETERQVYFAQSTGDREAGREPELALRFDLTVPLARYVAQYEHQLAFPFRRYQIQRVYRGERAQRGRFREFYQCDIDIVGKDELPVRFDAELPAVIYSLFTELGFGGFRIQINNRKLLRGVLAALGIAEGEPQTLVLREVDKLDKRGPEYLRDTLRERFSLGDDIIGRLLAFVGTRSTSYAHARGLLADLERDLAHPLLAQGAAELREVLDRLVDFGVPDSHVCLNFAIARGLDYYTGTVYETILTDHPEIGSVCSGGRYDDLASHYTKSRLPGVGLSIGATRLFWQLRELGLYKDAESTVQVLVALMDESLLGPALQLATRLRAAGIAVEAQLEAAKLAKQLKYADRAGIRFVALLGSDELAKGVVSVKDMQRGTQFEVAADELAATLEVEIAQARAMAGVPRA
ncbi:histidyl-tRNA synthetase [Pseudofulvimonas gallinarii]|jgi:histidyl-tRNA synthetase|uniref:Histidine--tRNA ligase n=1 Tax=Pseudofulvimonas gallinarii TaxID=634155 RepID=A0A4V2UWG9_9GAMM|nr:histidyl-tRNA synthetase [Pseudofulvimonas gallinarii]